MSELASESNAEPNLTPILDMVFQLITFFMLVINFKSASMDLSLKLPVVGSAMPVKTESADLMVLNIDSKGTLRVSGEPRPNIDAFIAREAMQGRMAAKRRFPDMKDDDDLPSLIVIRADRDTPFSLLNRVILSCQQNGFRKFSLKALNKRPE